MSCYKKAWVAATSIGAVEALKDQLGICRWNYTFRSIHHNLKNNVVRSFSQAKQPTNCNSKMNQDQTLLSSVNKRPEQSFDKVMDMSCWGPTTVRF
ncbi:hypothetical protein QQ045_005946 [Rhodiola kirilowii]